MQKVLPFTCIKKHFEGEIFEPVAIGNDFELQSLNSVLVGSNGNAYKFKNADNANVWIESNLIRASKSKVTQQTHIDALVVKNSIEYKDYLATEIETLLERNEVGWNFDENIDGGNAIN